MKKNEFPIEYFVDNLVFNDAKNCWAIYEMESVGYEWETTEVKISYLNKLARFMANSGRETKYFVIPTAQNLDKIYENLKSKLSQDDPLYAFQKKYADTVHNYLEQRLQEGGGVNDYSVFIAVKLNKPEVKIPFGEILQHPLRAVQNYMAYDEFTIFESDIEAYREASKKFLSNQRKRIYIHETDTDTTQWLIKRMYSRGTNKEVQLQQHLNGKDWEPKYEETEINGKKGRKPLVKDIMALNGEWEQMGKKLKVTDEDGNVSWQSFLAFSFIPDGLEFPSGEWLLMLQDFPFPTEVCITVRTTEYQKAMKKLKENQNQIRGQQQHVQESGEIIPEDLFESEDMTKDLQSELKLYSDPLLSVGVYVCVAAPSEKILDKNVAKIISEYKDKEFRVQNPTQDQVPLFKEFVVGSPIYGEDYMYNLPPRTIAGSMFPVTKYLGDGEGNYIGTTGELQKNVFLNLLNASRHNESPAGAIIGALGSGKSFNANILAYTGIMQRQKGLIIDPKGDRAEWKQHLPELASNINMITLSGDEKFRGTLDPFIIYKDKPKDAESLALSMVCELYDISPKEDEYTVLTEALKKTSAGPSPCMKRLIMNLAKGFSPTDDLYRVAISIARKLKGTMEMGMASLIFGNGNEKAIALNEQLNVLMIQNIRMPDYGKPREEYNMDEIMSIVLMLPIASFAKKFAESNNKQEKFIILDESWALRQTSMGKSLYNVLARTGRSLNCATLFIGHSPQDIADEGVRAALTYIFMFKTKVRSDAILGCELLGIEPTEWAIDTLLTLPNGSCLFRDAAGNVDQLDFDVVFDHIAHAFDSNPNKEE